MTSPRYDVAIVGGGIIGLATAMEIVTQFPQQRVVVLEKEPELAAHQTGHNSGVIHAGIYYRPDSQKARFCVAGARMMREFCEQHGIRHELVGKVVVATDESELPALERLHERAAANGVEGLEMIGRERLREIEPHARGVMALWSPKTGIVDYRKVAGAYADIARERGADVLTGAQVRRILPGREGVFLETSRGDVQAHYLINCAGLYADVIARMAGTDPEVRIIPFRGEYYLLAPEKHDLVNGLIYPVPNPRFPFLGVHFTKVIHGGVEAGPNAVLAFAREGYTKTHVNPGELIGILVFPGFWRMALKYWRTGLEEMYRSFSKGAFARALQKLVPEIRQDDIIPAGAGVRAQAVDRQGRLLDDFSIVQGENAIHVLNAPSPAATSSLAIGRHITELASRSFRLAV